MYRSGALGIDPVTAATTAASIASAADQVRRLLGRLGIGSGARDDERMRQNEQAFRAAMAGDEHATAWLRQRTGLYGSAYIPVRLAWSVSPSTGAPETPGQIDGWATEVAREHARLLYADYERAQSSRILPHERDGFGLGAVDRASVVGGLGVAAVIAAAVFLLPRLAER